MHEITGNSEISHGKVPSCDFNETSRSNQVFDEIDDLKQNGEVFYIPLIKLIGYGKKQTFQCVCLKCRENYFNLERLKSFSDLFCSFCVPDKKCLNMQNIANTNYVGIIIGWEVKSSSDYKKRSFYNYKKVYIRDEYTCQYCNYNLRNCSEFRALHIDHIKPWSAGG